jgi:hypothetical protein
LTSWRRYRGRQGEGVHSSLGTRGGPGTVSLPPEIPDPSAHCTLAVASLLWAAVLWVKEDKIYGAKDPETAGDS